MDRKVDTPAVMSQSALKLCQVLQDGGQCLPLTGMHLRGGSMIVDTGLPLTPAFLTRSNTLYFILRPAYCVQPTSTAMYNISYFILLPAQRVRPTSIVMYNAALNASVRSET